MRSCEERARFGFGFGFGFGVVGDGSIVRPSADSRFARRNRARARGSEDFTAPAPAIVRVSASRAAELF